MSNEQVIEDQIRGVLKARIKQHSQQLQNNRNNINRLSDQLQRLETGLNKTNQSLADMIQKVSIEEGRTRGLGKSFIKFKEEVRLMLQEVIK